MPITRATALLALTALLVAACGAPAVPHHHATAPRRMTALQICQKLRADVIANGGDADAPTVRHLLAQHPPNVGGLHPGYGLADDLRRLMYTELHPQGDASAAVGLVEGWAVGDCQRAEAVEIPTGA